jgi:methylated-DNA-[protein]-cysteine S-methyltransferase
MSSLVQSTFPSPLGHLQLVADDSSLVAVIFPSHRRAPALNGREVTSHPVLERASSELDEYFRGARLSFSTPLARGGTAFQSAVWDALATIPFGETRSYQQLAVLVRKPLAVRAVGNANGRNPLSIFVPCHRVIGANGSLTGYAGGMEFKQWLLRHERRVLEKLHPLQMERPLRPQPLPLPF